MNEVETPAATTETAPVSSEPEAAASASTDAIREKIVQELHTVYDPEIPVDIYELGLIYEVDVAASGEVRIKMTLTSPMCPAAEQLPGEVETKARGVDGVTSVELDLVWDPPWSPERMSEAAKLELGMV